MREVKFYGNECDPSIRLIRAGDMINGECVESIIYSNKNGDKEVTIYLCTLDELKTK